MTGELISRKKLQSIFTPGRKLELIGCLVPMPNGPQQRTVKAIKSYGFDMERPDGKVSRLDFLPGQKIEAFSEGGEVREIVLWDAGSLGVAAAHYRLL